jgi:hypothetical protein
LSFDRVLFVGCSVNNSYAKRRYGVLRSCRSRLGFQIWPHAAQRQYVETCAVFLVVVTSTELKKGQHFGATVASADSEGLVYTARLSAIHSTRDAEGQKNPGGIHERRSLAGVAITGTRLHRGMMTGGRRPITASNSVPGLGDVPPTMNASSANDVTLAAKYQCKWCGNMQAPPFARIEKAHRAQARRGAAASAAGESNHACGK